MRLTYVIPYFAPAWGYGGPPRLAYDLARRLVQAGHEVRVLTSDALDGTTRATPSVESLDGISIQRLPNISNTLAWKYKLFFPRGFGRAFRAVVGCTDLVQLFDFRDYQNAVVLAELQHTRLPFVLSALGELPRASGPKRPVKLVYDILVGYRLVRQAAALLAQTPQEAAWYERLGGRPEQIRLLPLAIDLDGLSPSTGPGVFRAGLGIGPQELVVLFLGRIHAYKGLDVLIRAFARALSQRRNARLVIAGRDDGYLASVRDLAQQVAPPGSVVFPGPVYGAARFSAYRDADLFAVTPSHFEQTSLAALEAAACGTPVLVTEQSPIPGLDESGGGLTVKYNVDAVVDGLVRLLDSNLTEMGARAERLVREHFALSRVTSQLEQIYAEILARRQAT